jgi:hypothetical protein
MTKEDLDERFGREWEIHAPLTIGVAASRRQQRLTPEGEASGMVLVLIAADLEELADRLAAQPDSYAPVTRLTAHAVDEMATATLGMARHPWP